MDIRNATIVHEHEATSCTTLRKSSALKKNKRRAATFTSVGNIYIYIHVEESCSSYLKLPPLFFFMLTVHIRTSLGI